MSNSDRHRSSEQRLSPEQLGRVYNSLVDELAHEHSRKDDETWARICSRMDSAGQRPRVAAVNLDVQKSSRRRVSFFAAAAMVFGLSLWSVRSLTLDRHSEARLSFVVDGGATSRHVDSAGGRLIVSQFAPVELRFSDNSRVELEPQSTVRVEIDRDERVSTRLAQGTLNVDVEHGENTDYRFLAGPYEVQVVGTAFQLGFEPEGARLDLVMTEGKVVVVDGEGRMHVVSAGEELHVGEKPVAKGDSTPREPKLEIDLESPESGEKAKPRLVQLPSAEPSSVQPQAGEFRALGRAGKFEEIVARSRLRGIDVTLNERSAAELQELAQAARYGGDFALAERVWSSMRVRFSSSSTGRNAVFFLGRLAEQRGRSAMAIAHYGDYLKSGGGSYSAEALGRNLQLVRSERGDAAARPMAREYLIRFPNGAYVKTAQELLGKD
jgi:hypothetical protein